MTAVSVEPQIFTLMRLCPPPPTNRTELGALFGVEDLEYAESVELAHQLQLEGARNVMVSMGNERS